MNNKNKLIWWVVAIIIVVGLVWWGVSKNVGGAGNVIKVGFIGPLTGDAAAYGESAQNIAQLAVGEINAAGGINGKQIQVIYEDGACDGATAANAMQKLANVDNVQAVLGGYCSAESLAAVPIATQSKVMMISISSSPKLTDASPYFVRDYPSDDSEGNVLADAAWNIKHWKTVAFIQEQTDYPAGIYSAFAKEFQSLGGQTVNEQYVTNTSDFHSLLLKLKSQNPDALVIDSNGSADAPRILQQMKDMGWDPPLMVIDSVAQDAKVISADASSLEGALTAEFPLDASSTQFQHLLTAYKTKYGVDVPFENYAQTEYDTVLLLVDGIKAVGDNGSALAAWSRTIKDWQGASGIITIDANGDRIGGDVLQVIHNGTVQPVQQ
jgi:branched-chain amino acid transport system substrate-binding protein